AGTGRIRLDEVRLIAEARSASEVLQDVARALHPGPPRGNVVEIGFGDPTLFGRDVSKAGNSGTLASGNVVPGIQGMCFDTAGVGQVSVPHSATLGIPETVTAEVWMKSRAHAQGPALLLGKWSGSAPGWRLGLEAKT